VSGAHTGRDMVSSVASGLLTIGSRFGGALDAAGLLLLDAMDRLTPSELVVDMHTRKVRIPGIGHRVNACVADPIIHAAALYHQALPILL